MVVAALMGGGRDCEWTMSANPRPAEPIWWTHRFGTISAEFAALEAARTPDPQPIRPRAPVIALDGVRVERAVKRINALIRKAM